MKTIAESIVEFLGTQSLHLLVLFAAVLAVTVLLRNRSAHLRYLLWLLVVAKCLIPPVHTVSLAVLPERAEQAVPVQMKNQTAVETVPVAVVPDSPAARPAAPVVSAPEATLAAEEPVAPVSAPAIAGSPAEPAKSAFETMTAWIPAVWLGGAAVYLMLVTVKGVRFERYVGRHRTLVTAASHPAWAGFLAAALPRGKRVQVYQLDRAGQPFVWGLWKGAIYLPGNFADVNDSEKQQSILMHEAGHILRLDPLINFLQVLAQGLFWFHPLVWTANRIIRAEREKCCDEFAVATLKAAPRSYCAAIVDALMAAQTVHPTIPTLAVAGPVKNIEDRIKTLLTPGRRFYTRPTTIVLGTICLLAALVVPTTVALSHRIKPVPASGLYENAKGSQNYKIKVGPTNFEAHTVVRYNRNGEPIIKNPDGSEKKIIRMRTPIYSAQTPWMDIAQIYLSPDPTKFDVIELRVFNHQTRQLLDKGEYPGIGYNIEDSVVSIYSTGKELPTSLDIWLRVLHNIRKHIYILQAHEQAAVDIDGNTLRIVDIARGVYSWALGKRMENHPGWEDRVTSVALEFDKRGGGGYQICAVGKDGRRVVPDSPHFLRPSNGKQIVEFGIPIDQIKYLELQPFQGRDRFYFDNVKLPARSGGLDAALPIRFSVGDAAGQFQQHWSPFSTISLRTLPDTEITGIENSALGTAYHTKTSDRSLNTIVCVVPGFSAEKTSFAAYDKKGNLLDLSPKGSHFTSGNNTTCYGVETSIPLERIDTLDVYFETTDGPEKLPLRTIQSEPVSDTQSAVLLPEHLWKMVLSLRTGEFISQQQAEESKEPYLYYNYTFPGGANPRNFTVATVPEDYIGVDTGNLEIGGGGFGDGGRSLWAIRKSEQLPEFQQRMDLSAYGQSETEGWFIHPPLDASWPYVTAFKGDDGTYGIFEITKVADRKIYLRFKTFATTPLNEPTVALRYLAWQPEQVGGHIAEPEFYWTPEGKVLETKPEMLQTEFVRASIQWPSESYSRPLRLWFENAYHGIASMGLMVRLAGKPLMVSFAETRKSDDYGLTMAAIAVEKSMDLPESGNLEVSYAVGDWKTVTEFDTKKGKVQAYTVDEGVTWGFAMTADGLEATLAFETEPDPDRIEYRQILVGHEKDDHYFKTARRGQNGLENTLCYKGLKPSDLRRVQIQSRPRTSKVFYDVVLRPGEKTDVKIEVEKPETKAAEEKTQALQDPLSLSIDLSPLKAGVPLAEAIAYVQNYFEPPLPVEVDWEDLKTQGEVLPTDKARPRTYVKAPAGEALREILYYVSKDKKPVDFIIEDGRIVIKTNPYHIEEKTYTLDPKLIKDLKDTPLLELELERWLKVKLGQLVYRGKWRGASRLGIGLVENTLFVAATGENHKKISELLAHLEPLQLPDYRFVSLECRVLTVDEAFSRDSGFDVPKAKEPAGRILSGAVNDTVMCTLLNAPLPAFLDIPLETSPDATASLDNLQTETLLRAVPKYRNSRQLTAPRAFVLNGDLTPMDVSQAVSYTDTDGQLKQFKKGIWTVNQPMIEDDTSLRLKGYFRMVEVTGQEKQIVDGREYSIPVVTLYEAEYHRLVPNSKTVLLDNMLTATESERDETTTVQRLMLLVKPTIISTQPDAEKAEGASEASGGV